MALITDKVCREHLNREAETLKRKSTIVACVTVVTAFVGAPVMVTATVWGGVWRDNGVGIGSFSYGCPDVWCAFR